MKLIAGNVAEEYNQRKNRINAFWEDIYHSTETESDSYLVQYLSYVEWISSGYNEIQNPKQRYNLIDLRRLPILFGYDSLKEFQKHHKIWIDEALKNDRLERHSKLSKSITFRRNSFVEEVHKKLSY